jgi:acyl-coenzyme A thioesterase PaaI-like protein
VAAGQQFDTYDASVAESFIKGSERPGGLTGFLGLKITEVGPGWMRAEAEVTPELLTPFGNIHGGVMAASCDHLLGCVCYPLMKKGHCAAQFSSGDAKEGVRAFVEKRKPVYTGKPK